MVVSSGLVGSAFQFPFKFPLLGHQSSDKQNTISLAFGQNADKTTTGKNQETQYSSPSPKNEKPIIAGLIYHYRSFKKQYSVREHFKTSSCL